MSRLFGWDLPPGVSQRDIDNAYGQDHDPTPEAEYVGEFLNEIVSGLHNENVAKATDKIFEYVDELAMQLHEAKKLLQDTQRFLPERGPEPKCTCRTEEYGYCDLHTTDWFEPTLKEEVISFLARNKK